MKKGESNFDPVTLGLFSSRLEERSATKWGPSWRNAAFSPNIRDRLDFSCAIFDARGELCAQAAHIPVHPGAAWAYAMSGIVARMAWLPAVTR